MKKSNRIFLVVILVLLSMVIWYFSIRANIKPINFLNFGIMLLILVFALLIGIKRIGNEKRGEPDEDELSKSILQKSAALSYYISLYMWVFMIWLKDRLSMAIDEVLGSGILAMAVIFGLSWIYVRFKGVHNG